MNKEKLTHAELASRLDSIPRIHLAHLPTPLDECPKLSEKLGGPRIFIKRDDMTGLAFGGNKTRQLEFLLAEVLTQNIDVLVAGAYTQSNWCRQITAATRKLGMDVSLVLAHGEKGPSRQGNLLLDELMGAEIQVVDLEDIQDLPPLLDAEAERQKKLGRRPFIIDPFRPDVLARSALGYVQAVLEMELQFEDFGIRPDWVFVSGANMTPAGLSLGFQILGRETRVSGIAPILWDEDRKVDIARIANATAKLLECDLELSPSDILSSDEFIGERYGVLTQEGRDALKLVAETEGIFLDPVYTSKAMAGMIDQIRKGIITKNETVVFIHTGGLPALFAYAEDLMHS